MNSLKYLSSRVDRVFGQEQNEDVVEISSRYTPPIDFSIDEEEPLLENEKQDITVKASATSGHGSLISSYLFPPLIIKSISKLISFIFFLASFLNPFAYFKRKPVPSTAVSQEKLVAGRGLQSPYTKGQHQHSHLSSSLSQSTRYLSPPRPLLMKRPPPKTLVLDLDETLIHSLSQGSNFSTGQMVEVKLDNQVATLYYVRKRPYCDYFLKCVSEWFHLVVFTASVPAYADPMIDWLEQERKYFSRRLYRNECTATPSGYVKDLSIVESDLSKVFIIDNSPISYSKQNENAIGIEGWISDSSDHNLLHLIPLLHALRYSLDVRSVLSLKMGEASFE
ncbi:Nem1-Spo7 phosphatase catalytic subunit NEM1 [Sugiyamaella lignohabitans]|uniref:Nem1-Spo7 phosphatase catalytic subunit NEM1 n=1 Tax=Sugiyamaella lignohabitans TaxID=796027 RepID=A0A167FRA9_9ASCO|nr:Nem1-Spo7 phosphatase catalytic subunit NEM1 [Sugiyamaella lignohabitans]ANB15601.1 Nem1-Spo7 phosphatase catalytic subunit NEM1 [Sugiyamaella lignohabitans]